MAVDKGLVLVAINKKFEGKSLSKTFKENLATKWAVKIDNETDIDAYVDDREDVVLEASTEADRRATDAVKKITLPKVEKKEDKADEIVIDETEGMTAFENMMLQKFGALETKITGFETQQTQKTLTERFKSHPELKGIPEFMFKGRIPSTEEEFDNAVSELKTDYSGFATENKLASLGNDVPNNFGGLKNILGEVKPASKEDVDKLAKSLII
jgi:hypothetical protein